jgi:hypothetical protein
MAAVTVVAALVSAITAVEAVAQRARVATGFGVATGIGSIGQVTGPGGYGTIGAGFPRGDRFTFWIEGSAEGLPGGSNPELSGDDWQWVTRYLAAGEYRFTRPWNAWRVSGTLGIGVSTFWDDEWPVWPTSGSGLPDLETGPDIVALSGTHFTLAPGFRVAYSIDPNLDLELVGRANVALYEGETFRFDTTGVRIDLEPPGSPIASWGLTLGTRLRAGGAPHDREGLEPGDRVRLWTTDGRQLEGRWIGIAGRRLSLAGASDDGGVTRIDVDAVQNAAVLQSSADRGGLIGAGVVGAAGVFLGVIAGQVGCEVDCSGAWVGPAAAAGLAGAAMGFVAGSLLGGLEHDWKALSL